ncbi:MAG TPA: metallophosphoesterase [Candidatus Acidoferrales bacterium]|nr:metallophosphoesterase [Candidatus Acidoferrales bacterium]
MNEETKGTRAAKPWWRRHPVAIAILAIVAALGVDAFLIEPYDIEVTHYTIQTGEGGAPTVKSPLKIADLTDLHTRGIGWRERKLLEVLAEEKPDVILITGDTLADPLGNYRAVREVYEQLHAPLGVWFVHGNWENIRPVRHEQLFYHDAGVSLLLNQNHELRPDVWLVGLDDAATGRPNLNEALEGVPTNVYTIAMFHAPAYFDRIAGRVNLVLAGHTHGGQVLIPFVKPFWLPYGSGRFLSGWYEEKGTRMYVSRGLGMSDIPIRFRCRPEITFITLEP